MGAGLWQFIAAHYSQVLDSVLVAVLLYAALAYTRGSKAAVLLQAAVAFTVLYVAAQNLHLDTLAWLLEKLIIIAPVAAVVVFTPEIRAALDRAGRRSRLLGFLSSGASGEPPGQPLIEQLADAAQELATRRIGALIVIDSDGGAEEHIVKGEHLDAVCSDRLLLSLFDRHNPLHDGAVIIRGDRLHSACNFLPLTDSTPPDQLMGSRHRAALGLSERCEALCIVVSEQRGEISLVFRGRMARGLNRDQLIEQMTAILEPNENHSTLVPRAAAL